MVERLDGQHYIEHVVQSMKSKSGEGTMPITGLTPLVNDESEIIIVGTLPGTISLIRQEYYADPSNQFWLLLEFATGITGLLQASYKQKCELLLKNKIALWDVLESAERDGATDRGFFRGTEKINDFKSFFQQYPRIKKVIILGKTAAKYYKAGVTAGTIPSSITNLFIQSSSSTPEIGRAHV